VPRARTNYAVWEITLKCNLACSHCGSRAGVARENELTTSEALDLVRQMADLGIDEVTMIGGEAYLRPDWLEIAAEIVHRGMTCGMTTGGYGISRTTAEHMHDAGISTVSVSVDGLEATHDRLRGVPGSWRRCFETIGHVVAAGIDLPCCNTQFNRLSAPEMPLIYDEIRKASVAAWQVQLTVPMGRAADHPELLLQPFELLELYPMLAHVIERARREGVDVQPGNDVGYYGPYESVFRSMPGDNGFWQGCMAGLQTIGIEADGAIKGCPSLPTASYVGGNIRERSLKDIVQTTDRLRFNIGAGTPSGADHTWGFCGSCEYRELCRGGCTWTAHVLFDRPGNNPYCHHRALTLASRGVGEEVNLVERAPGLPFDHGRFELHERSLVDAGIADPGGFSLAGVLWPLAWLEEDPSLPARLATERDRTIASYGTAGAGDAPYREALELIRGTPPAL
jgi:radical SAM protein with 4Fe4S-binding SPASM domain